MSSDERARLPAIGHRRTIVAAVFLHAGYQLAHYEILEPIGKGGMARKP